MWSTFSWQKVMGGEAAHGVIVLGPRAVERLESYAPDRPLPKIFRLTSKGQADRGDLRGRDDQHAVDALRRGLDRGAGVGPLGRRPRRAGRAGGCQRAGGLGLLRGAATGSRTSPRIRPRGPTPRVCLRFTDPRIADGAAFAKAVAKRLEAAGAALDVGAYRDAPPGLRIWCGSTVETADVEAMLPWLDWAFEAEIDKVAQAA